MHCHRNCGPAYIFPDKMPDPRRHTCRRNPGKAELALQARRHRDAVRDRGEQAVEDDGEEGDRKIGVLTVVRPK